MNIKKGKRKVNRVECSVENSLSHVQFTGEGVERGESPAGENDRSNSLSSEITHCMARTETPVAQRAC